LDMEQAHLWYIVILISIYRAGATAGRPTLLPRQIQALREAPNVQVFISVVNLYQESLCWNDSLQNNYYHHPALIPPMEWIDSTNHPANCRIKSLELLPNSITIEISSKPEDRTQRHL
jgi:hypothetical protein